jgi:hyperosmotically inducible periplasmic protein
MRALLIVVLLCVVAFFAFGLWSSGSLSPAAPGSAPVATSGTADTATARERGAELAEKAANATEKVKETVADGRLTTKIKAKMALDDHVKARRIDVTTNGSTVTLTGTVASAAEHDRAVRLARETDGVTQVVDRLRIER